MSEYDGGFDEAATDDCCCDPAESPATAWDATDTGWEEPAYEAPAYDAPVYEEAAYPVADTGYAGTDPALTGTGYVPVGPSDAGLYPTNAVVGGTDHVPVGPSDAGLYPTTAVVGGGDHVPVGPSDAGLYPTTAVIGGGDGPDFTIVGPSDAGLFGPAVVGGTGSGFSAGDAGGLYATSAVVGGPTRPDPVYGLLNTMSEFVDRSYDEQQAALAALAARGIDPAADPSLTRSLLSDWFKGIRGLEDTMSPNYHYGDDRDPNSRFYRDRP